MDLTIKIAGIKLEHPLMNAPGTCKKLDGPESVAELAKSATSAIVVGSITYEERDGNEGQVLYPGEGFTLNSLGMPNPGRKYYEKNLPEIVEIAHDAGKLLIVSVAGFSPEENAALAEIAFAGGADLVELNLGCPNVWGGGSQKPIVSFDLDVMEANLYKVGGKVGADARVGVKLSPYSNPAQLVQMAKVVSMYQVVKFITTMNTFPNSLCFDEKGRPVIAPAGGYAGLSGHAVLPMMLGQVRQFYEADIGRDLIATGGITCGKDMRDAHVCGASAMQIASAVINRGPQVFGEMLADYIYVLETE